ncbi:MAG: hypothetical protein P1U63_12075 [Coxiellaceae bacterium]|nr:hypothetical protein [Coxiellaceae bacterium]
MAIKTAFSLDMDGCFDKLRPAYKIPYTWFEPNPESISENERQQFKASIIEHLRSIILGEATTFIGSNRQSIHYDLINASNHHNGLAIDVIPHIAELIGSDFCPLLLSDFRLKGDTPQGDTLPQRDTRDHYGESRWDEKRIRQLEQDDQIFRLTPGYSLTHFTDGTEIPFTGEQEATTDDKPHREYKQKDTEKYLNSPWNSKKTEIIRRQIEFMRESMDKDDILYFNFYDDRADILNALTEYFQIPGNLPDNVVLCLAQFNTSGMERHGILYSENDASLIKYRLPIVNSIDLLDHAREHAPHLIVEDLREESPFTLLLSGQFARADQLITALWSEPTVAISERIIELIASSQAVATKLRVINHYAHLLTAEQHSKYCYEAISKMSTDSWYWHTKSFKNKAINTLALVPTAYRKRCIDFIMASKIASQWKLELVTDTAQLITNPEEYSALFIEILQNTLRKIDTKWLRNYLTAITADGRVPERWLPITDFICAIITTPNSPDNIKQLLMGMPEDLLDTAVDCITNMKLEAMRKVELLDACQSRRPSETLYESYQYTFYLQLQSPSLDGELDKLLHSIPNNCIATCIGMLLEATNKSHEFKLILLTQCWDLLPPASRDMWIQQEYLRTINPYYNTNPYYYNSAPSNAIKVMSTEHTTACITASLETHSSIYNKSLFIVDCLPYTHNSIKQTLYNQITNHLHDICKTYTSHNVTHIKKILTNMPVAFKRRWINDFIRDGSLLEVEKKDFITFFATNITENVALTPDNQNIYTHVVKALSLCNATPPKKRFTLFSCCCDNTLLQFELLKNLNPDSDTPLHESITRIVALSPHSPLAENLHQAMKLPELVKILHPRFDTLTHGRSPA